MGEARRELDGDGGPADDQWPTPGVRDEARGADSGGNTHGATGGGPISKEIRDEPKEVEGAAAARIIPVSQATLDRIAKNIENGVLDDENPRSQEYYSRMGLDVVKVNQGQQKIDLDREREEGPQGNVFLFNLLGDQLEAQKNIVESITKKVAGLPLDSSGDLDLSDHGLSDPEED